MADVPIRAVGACRHPSSTEWFFLDPKLHIVDRRKKLVDGLKVELVTPIASKGELVVWKQEDRPLAVVEALQQEKKYLRSGKTSPKKSRDALTREPMVVRRLSVKLENVDEVLAAFRAPIDIKQEPENTGLDSTGGENEGMVDCKAEPSGVAKRAGTKRAIRTKITTAEKRLCQNPIVEDGTAARVPVDRECRGLVGDFHVYRDGDVLYDVMLNQTNVEYNNNKFFLLQVLEDELKERYSVWFRWGRVGKVGQSKLHPCGSDSAKAKLIFEKKFYDKTLNDFHELDQFCKVHGKYDIVRIATRQPIPGDELDQQAVKTETPSDQEIPASKLEPTLRGFVELICDLGRMEQALRRMNYDPSRAPLGQLSLQQISAGYAALKVIEDCVSNGLTRRKLVVACNDFYTRIPHSFGMRAPPLITTYHEIREKIDLLEMLTDVKASMRLAEEEAARPNINPIDRRYASLNVPLRQILGDELEFIDTYLQTTHAPTHNQYRMEIVSAFEVVPGTSRFPCDINNRALLWHGSRLTNVASIVSQGLRIAPPEAPSTGYMFGKGVYFADSSSKSANYCFPTALQDEGVLLLCEVALGDQLELFEADIDAPSKLQGMCSVKGCGSFQPETSIKRKSAIDGIYMEVPCGKLVESPDLEYLKKCTLNYNEYIVYDTKQIMIRYALRIKFHFRF